MRFAMYAGQSRRFDELHAIQRSMAVGGGGGSGRVLLLRVGVSVPYRDVCRRRATAHMYRLRPKCASMHVALEPPNLETHLPSGTFPFGHRQAVPSRDSPTLTFFSRADVSALDTYVPQKVRDMPPRQRGPRTPSSGHHTTDR